MPLMFATSSSFMPIGSGATILDEPQAPVSSLKTLICSSPSLEEYRLHLNGVCQSACHHEHVTDTLTTALDHSNVDDEIRRELDRITETVQQCMSSFQLISMQLVEFDSACFHDERGCLLRLFPEWEMLRQVSNRLFVLLS